MLKLEKPCQRCGSTKAMAGTSLPRCDNCGIMQTPFTASCFENGHADGSTDVGHAPDCKGDCGIPREGRDAPRRRKPRGIKGGDAK